MNTRHFMRCVLTAALAAFITIAVNASDDSVSGKVLAFKSDDGKTKLEIRAFRFGKQLASRTEPHKFLPAQTVTLLPVQMHEKRRSDSDTLMVILTFTEGNSLTVNLEKKGRCSITRGKGKPLVVRGSGAIEAGKEVCEFNQFMPQSGLIASLLSGKNIEIAFVFDAPAELNNLRLNGIVGFSKIYFDIPNNIPPTLEAEKK